ncbi:MAG: 2-C-methyl-D-erythritol 4-phosphate cytidylyltransferase [Lachnospiraceae bacterium]|jgi:2-C-methyl-D-erythritol 4-phosphate cytidylyltransferase|nr:2-C-methyl-D-erythritol 4-phosphate cytidylyltransferase [Lachnospiraceae bacterium]
MTNIALILSGGAGLRAGTEIPKQYIEAGGRPVISYCIETFEALEEIDYIQIVAEPEWYPFIEKELHYKPYGFSKPGKNRQMSIFHGLTDLLPTAGDNTVVVIHDAARPRVSGKQILDCIGAVKGHDGAMPVLPMKDTVYLSTDGQSVTSLLNRSQIYAGQAPECFLLKPYYEANRALLPDRILAINGSTEPAILAGMDIALVKGEETNSKITTEKDLKEFIGLIAALKDGPGQGKD